MGQYGERGQDGDRGPDGELGPDGDLDLVLVPMRWWHVATVAELEPTVFATDPWTAELFWSELAQGDQRHYLTALWQPRGAAAHDLSAIIGYAGLALADDGAYIQTVGVVPRIRGRGVGARLMIALLRHARRAGARSCGLEVRTDNHAARALYTRLGFVDIGVRRGYYQPSGGDAYVMRARPIDTVGYAALLDEVERALPGRVRLEP
ncbi:putative acetyltransferase [Frankia alni ACN14a]|uniref:Acetyltransferase n=2 Tax=Frankia TaxID=1854 RepID=Q0RRM4_FRAAA|nr:putative acetyltransferase [Frankia alni ACN14a]